MHYVASAITPDRDSMSKVKYRRINGNEDEEQSSRAKHEGGGASSIILSQKERHGILESFMRAVSED